MPCLVANRSSLLRRVPRRKLARGVDIDSTGGLMADRTVTFTGIHFENPFLLSSAPPTESESNILRAFEAGWGGVVTKTIGLHRVTNVRGPRTTFLRVDDGGSRLSMAKRPDSTLVASWNW